MKDRANALASRWIARAEPYVRALAGHPLAVDLTIVLGLAAVSIAGLGTQGRIAPRSVAFCVALCLPLAFHRRDPRVTFALVSLVALLQWWFSVPQIADGAVLLALFRVAEQGDAIEVFVAGLVVEAGAIMAAARWSPSAPLKVWVGLSGLGTAAGVLGLTVRQRRALLLSLRERAAQLELERDQEGRLGAAAERARIAREMHDIVAHNLSVMIALADGASYAIDSSPRRAGEALERISQTGRGALLEMRRLLGVLREDKSEQPLAPQPRLQQLDELLAQVNAAGIPVTAALDGDLRGLPEGIQLTVFRVAQEALTNTLKHASRPARAHLELRCRGEQVELDVTDSAVGAAPSPGATSAVREGAGRGLHGMRERAAMYGGSLDAGPAPDGGWRVSLRLRSDRVAAAAR